MQPKPLVKAVNAWVCSAFGNVLSKLPEICRCLRREATEKLLLEGDIASLAACLKMSLNKSLQLATFSFKYESIAFSKSHPKLSLTILEIWQWH